MERIKAIAGKSTEVGKVVVENGRNAKGKNGFVTLRGDKLSVYVVRGCCG